MYLHIGKNCVINENKVIGIFNINKIKDTLEFFNMYENLKEKNQLEDISVKLKNSFILTESDNVVKGYISNIGTNTIKKRKIV